MLVEVKSSVGRHGAVTLTRSEYLAAKEHGASFVLAIVEDMATDSPRLTMVQDPVNAANVSEQSTVAYRIKREDWLRAAGSGGE